MKVFLDVDGVVIDGWHADPKRRKPWDATLQQDIGVDRVDFARALFSSPEAGSEPLMNACARGEQDLKEVLRELLPSLGFSGSVETFLEYWFHKDSNLNQDVLEIVRRLRQQAEVELYLATSQEHHRAAYLWHDLAMKELFHDIFYSARLGLLKDSSAFFFEINRRLSMTDFEHPLFFDDREDVVMLAREAGWDAHLFETVEDLTRNTRIQRLLGP